MSLVRLDPVYLSFRNDNKCMMPSCIVDGQPNTFVLTTGGFPQDMVFLVGTSASCNVSCVRLFLHEAKHILLEKCSLAIPTTFQKMAECTLKRSNNSAKQVEQLEFDMNDTGKGIRYLRLRLLSGYSQFVGVFGVEAEGEESQQRIAILESQPEVNM